MLVQRDFGGMEEGLYVGRKNNTYEYMKVMEFGV